VYVESTVNGTDEHLGKFLNFSLYLYVLFYFSPRLHRKVPLLAEYGFLLVPIALATGPAYYYYSYKNAASGAAKNVVLACCATFFAVIGATKALEWGFPYDDPAQQMEATETSEEFNFRHLLLHLFLLVNVWTTHLYASSSSSGATATKKKKG